MTWREWMVRLVPAVLVVGWFIGVIAGWWPYLWWEVWTK